MIFLAGDQQEASLWKFLKYVRTCQQDRYKGKPTWLLYVNSSTPILSFLALFCVCNDSVCSGTVHSWIMASMISWQTLTLVRISIQQLSHTPTHCERQQISQKLRKMYHHLVNATTKRLTVFVVFATQKRNSEHVLIWRKTWLNTAGLLCDFGTFWLLLSQRSEGSP